MVGKCFAVYPLSEEHLLDAIDTKINNGLKAAKLNDYKGNPPRYAEKYYHPTEDLCGSFFNFERGGKWVGVINKHIVKGKMINITEDWYPLLTEKP